MNLFAVNILAVFAMQAVEDRPHLVLFFVVDGPGRRSIQTKTHQSCLKAKLSPMPDCAARNMTNESKCSVCELCIQLNVGHAGKIVVSYGGSWISCGNVP